MNGSNRLDRIVSFRLVTQDIARLTRFYHDGLGFTLEGAPQAIAADEMVLLGLSGGGMRQFLRIGEQSLALDQFEIAGRAYPADSDAASLWFQHFALVVVDIARAHDRLRDTVTISEDGPQHLPASSGNAHAFKFRDPDGHPLELLQFPQDAVPEAWRDRIPGPGRLAVGIDHSAISVADVEKSMAFYSGLALQAGQRTLNEGPAQQHLDGLRDVVVTVVPMVPNIDTPHLELLGYRFPRGKEGATLRPNDVAATRIVWRGMTAALIADPDGHLHQIEV